MTFAGTRRISEGGTVMDFLERRSNPTDPEVSCFGSGRDESMRLMRTFNTESAS